MPPGRDGPRVWSRSGTAGEARPVGAVGNSGGMERGELRAPGIEAGQTVVAPARNIHSEGSWGILALSTHLQGGTSRSPKPGAAWVGTLAGSPRCPAQRGIVSPVAGSPPPAPVSWRGQGGGPPEKPFHAAARRPHRPGERPGAQSLFHGALKGEGEPDPGPAAPGAADPQQGMAQPSPVCATSAPSTPKVCPTSPAPEHPHPHWGAPTHSTILLRQRLFSLGWWR